jgi:hypothetical protein
MKYSGFTAKLLVGPSREISPKSTKNDAMPPKFSNQSQARHYNVSNAMASAQIGGIAPTKQGYVMLRRG